MKLNNENIKIGDGVELITSKLHAIVEVISSCGRYAKVKMIDGRGPYKRRLVRIVDLKKW